MPLWGRPRRSWRTSATAIITSVVFFTLSLVQWTTVNRPLVQSLQDSLTPRTIKDIETDSWNDASDSTPDDHQRQEESEDKSVEEEGDFFEAPPVVSHHTAVSAARELTPTSDDDFRILPGELPGYTGWARPTTTLARQFRAVPSNKTMQVTQGDSFRLQVQDSSSQHDSLFFVRAYGPAILAGSVVAHDVGVYNITIGPLWDVGLYTLEIVLEFSDVSQQWWRRLPLLEGEPSYEGFVVSHAPRSFRVIHPESNISATENLPLCQTEHIVEDSSLSLKGRWKLMGKSILQEYNASSTHNLSVLESYQTGPTSLGFQTEYVPFHCRLMSREEASNPDSFRAVRKSSSLLHQQRDSYFHVVLIGDSNIKLQADLLRDYWRQLPIPITRISTNRGLVQIWSALQAKLHNISNGVTPDHTHYFLVLVNSGMHDIHRLCSAEMRGDRETYLTNATEQELPCIDLYQEYVGKLLDLIQFVLDPMLLVWESTTVRTNDTWSPDICRVCPLTLNDRRDGQSTGILEWHGRLQQCNP